jgi:hypothetical protein
MDFTAWVELIWMLDFAGGPGNFFETFQKKLKI